MPAKFRTPPAEKAPPRPRPDKAVLKPPRIKPAQMRNYGKGQSTLSQVPNGMFGSGVGFGDT